ncbi:MAG TPA: hypothetical protein VMG12_06540 [Polyangiaceae bacterium]|nr:hypothetical protein [Polyangiaceae bacterium]
MLPFEDRYTRQRRLPEVGPQGQERLQRAQPSVADHPDVALELDYLARAGASDARVDHAAAPLQFPWSSWFEHDAALGVARGAWCALTRIKGELDLLP